ncbi:hypothetical protein Bbelb_198080 [Branchiostoma belcheri]|nr:hypothetical protein Bbelb_198080 [Branchiostoma belcheri]
MCDLGFTLEQARSRRHPAKRITDADYADDLALLANRVADVETLLHALEEAASGVGLYVNARKTEYICFNQHGKIQSLNGTCLNEVEHFTYLGGDISSTEKDVYIRIAKAWGALNDLRPIWKSTLSDNIKRNFFRAVVESVLLYGSSTWTLTRKLESKLDGTYTRMLRAVLNKSWTHHPSKAELYGTLPPVSATIRERRARFAGHCYRNKRELVSNLLLWAPTHGHSSLGRPHRTYIDQLAEDAGVRAEHLGQLMADRAAWRERVDSVRATRPT